MKTTGASASRTSVLESNSSRGDDGTTPRLAGIELIVEIKVTADEQAALNESVDARKELVAVVGVS